MATTQHNPQGMPTTGGSPALSGKGMIPLVAALILCVLSYQLNASMITPALPDMAETLGVSVNDVSQVSSLFLLFGSIGGILLTRWSDYLGRRNMLFLILGCLFVGTLLALFSPNLILLLIGRALQGLSSATFQLSYLVLDEALDAKSFGVALGAITAINGGVGGFDGVLGGLLTEHFGYRSLFVVILAFVIVSFVAVLVAFPKNMPPSSKGRFDWWGGVFITVAVICLGQFISRGSGDWGWGDWRTIGLLAVSVAAMVLFFIREQRAADPVISIEELKSRQVWPLIAAVLLTLAGVYPVINFTLVVFSQNADAGFGMNASMSSLCFLVPPAVLGIVVAPIVGWIAPRVGWIRTLRIGLLVCLAAMAVLALFPDNLIIAIACVVVLGIGYNALALTTLNGLGVVLSPEASKGSLPAVSGACFGLGSSIGVALISPFVSSGTVGGVRIAVIIGIVITVLSFAASMAMRAADGRQS